MDRASATKRPRLARKRRRLARSAEAVTPLAAVSAPSAAVSAPRSAGSACPASSRAPAAPGRTACRSAGAACARSPTQGTLTLLSLHANAAAPVPYQIGDSRAALGSEPCAQSCAPGGHQARHQGRQRRAHPAIKTRQVRATALIYFKAPPWQGAGAPGARQQAGCALMYTPRRTQPLNLRRCAPQRRARAHRAPGSRPGARPAAAAARRRPGPPGRGPRPPAAAAAGWPPGSPPARARRLRRPGRWAWAPVLHSCPFLA